MKRSIVLLLLALVATPAFATQDLAHLTVKAVRHPVGRAVHGVVFVGKHSVVPFAHVLKKIFW